MSERADIESHFTKSPEIAVDRAGEIVVPGALLQTLRPGGKQGLSGMNCSQCGIQFEPNRPWQKYHSQRCRQRAYRTMVESRQERPTNASHCVNVTHSGIGGRREPISGNKTSEISILSEIRPLVEKVLELLARGDQS